AKSDQEQMTNEPEAPRATGWVFPEPSLQGRSEGATGTYSCVSGNTHPVAQPQTRTKPTGEPNSIIRIPRPPKPHHCPRLPQSVPAHANVHQTSGESNARLGYCGSAP